VVKGIKAINHNTKTRNVSMFLVDCYKHLKNAPIDFGKNYKLLYEKI